jgi:mevalonate kinase
LLSKERSFQQNGMNGEYQRKAHGKFLLTGEYLVLKGAEALALPLSLGQRMLAVPHEGNVIYWEGFAPEGKWFETALHADTLKVLTGIDSGQSERLAEVMREIRKQNPEFWRQGGRWVRTDLEFDPAFGMGSSSTFLSLLCDAAGVDPFPVLQATFGGSGYDLACAFAHGPLLYTLEKNEPSTRTVTLSPAITRHLLFVYSGNKMISSGEVKKFGSIPVPDALIQRVTEITRAAAASENLQEFADLMREHEQLLGEMLTLPTLQTRFPDLEGTVKSMGAWGGDFFLAVAEDTEKAAEYFRGKGFRPVYSYRDIAIMP